MTGRTKAETSRATALPVRLMNVMPRRIVPVTVLLSLALCLTTLVTCGMALAGEPRFAGAVSSASPEATAAGVGVLEAGGNAIDAAVAVSLALAVSEPAGSGLAGQTVMLIKPVAGDAFVIQGTTWSPHSIPDDATAEQLAYGHTAATVPSTLRVLDLAHRKFGSGRLDWAKLVAPAERIARDGFVIGPFRARAFRHYHEGLLRQPAAAGIYVAPDGRPWQAGEVFRQPQLAATLARIARDGAMDFYNGAIAAEIVEDMQRSGGWITARDLADFPEPEVVPPLRGSYRGHDLLTLPPPFGGWVVLQILNVLEQQAPVQPAGDTEWKLTMLDALRIGHASRQAEPVEDYRDYHADIDRRIAKPEAARLLERHREGGGETTHFSVVDGEGTVVSVTQSIDGYFGAQVAHPELGFLYNNYMQGFQVADPAAPFYLEEHQMPKSSMSATIALRDGSPVLVLGSPGSARIISAVAHVASRWIDTGEGIEQAVAASRVHVVPPDKAYVEAPELPRELLAGMAARGFRLVRPSFGVADQDLDPYFGGVHALALEHGSWTGAADPRRDGMVGYAWIREP